MATKTKSRRAAPKKAAAKRGKNGNGKAMMSQADLDKYYAAQAEAESARLPAGESQRLSIKGGTFTYKGADLGETMEVVILEHSFANTWFDRPYDPDNPGTPACAAIALDEDDLAPSKDAPIPQADSCAECEFNVFGSAEIGKGKACKNSIRVAMMAAGDLKSKPETIEIVRLDLPPMSIGPFSKYVKGLNKVAHRPASGVITTVGFDDDFDYPVVTFELKDKISSVAHAQLIDDKKKQAEELLLSGFDFTQYEPPAKKSKRAPAQKKAAAKKKSGKFGRRS